MSAYFSDRCSKSVEIKRDTFSICQLKLGHEGPCQPASWPKSAAALTAHAEAVEAVGVTIDWKKWGLGLSVEFGNPAFLRVWLGPVRLGVKWGFDDRGDASGEKR